MHIAQNERRRLVAVVVTHNRRAQLRETLGRLLASDEADLAAVVVVDNASSDGTAAWLSQQSDGRVCVMRQSCNLGGAGGFEVGMRVAVAQLHADWVVVMDDDARPAPGAIAAFHALREGGTEAIAAAVYRPDGAICEMNRPALNPFWHLGILWRTVLRGRDGFHLGPVEYRGNGSAVDVASFVGLFLSRRAVELAGFPDARLFLYGDDSLYTLGLRRAGGRIMFEPDLRFEHDLKTFDGPNGAFRPAWKGYYYHRNLLMLYRQVAGAFFWFALMVILPKWLWGRRGRSGGRSARRLLRRAVIDGLRRDLSLPHGSVLQLAGLGEMPAKGAVHSETQRARSGQYPVSES